MPENLITKAVEICGSYANLARIVGVSYVSIVRWEDKRRLPLTCHCGLKDYHEKIATAVAGAFTADELLEWSYAEWRRYYTL